MAVLRISNVFDHRCNLILTRAEYTSVASVYDTQVAIAINPYTILVRFRRDLSLVDNPALTAVVRRADQVIPLFIYCPWEYDPRSPGATRRWWRHHSLEALETSLAAKRWRLVIRHGPSLETLQQLIHEAGAQSIFWNRLYEPAWCSVMRRSNPAQ